MRRLMVIRRPVGAALALAAAIALVIGCGGDDTRDEALDGLDRATEAANLQGEMAELVAAIPDDTAQAGAEVEAQLADIDGRTSDLITAADTGTDYDEQIASAATDTRDAGSEVNKAVASAEPLDAVRPGIVSKLTDSGKKLGSATTLIGTELEDKDGQLSAEDAEALEATLAEIDASDAAVARVSDFRDLVFDFEGVGNLRIGMTAEEAAAAGIPLELSAPFTESPCVSYSIQGFDALGGISQDGRTISSIDATEGTGDGAQTSEGVGIGSTVAEFEAAYPGMVEPTDTVSVGKKFMVKQGEDVLVFATFDETDIVRYLGVGPGTLALEGCL